MGWWAILHQPVPSHARLRALTIQLGLYPAARVVEVGGDALEAVRAVLAARAGDVVGAMGGGAVMGQDVRDVLGCYLSALGVQDTGALLAAAPSSSSAKPATATTPSEGVPAGSGDKLVLHDDDLTAAEKARSNDQAAAQLAGSGSGVADAAAQLKSDDAGKRLEAARLLRKALCAGE